MKIGRLNISLKRNVSRTNARISSEGLVWSVGTQYIDYLIDNKCNDFDDPSDRVDVCRMDGKANRLTHGLAKRFTAKTFKFYSSHELSGVEIMQDLRAKWIELDADKVLRKCIVPFERDGNLRLVLDIDKKKGIFTYDVYDEYQCPPDNWMRNINNKIIGYKVDYIPRPRAEASHRGNIYIFDTPTNLKKVKKVLTVDKTIHIERGEDNLGYGDSAILPAWDPITKLREESHSKALDNRKTKVLHIAGLPTTNNVAKAKVIMDQLKQSDSKSILCWFHDTINGEVSEYPKFEKTNFVDPGKKTQTTAINTADYGGVSEEWGNLCSATGYNINYFMGNRAGAVTGSETDKLEDTVNEIMEFGLVEVIIRKILEWFNEQGIIKLPTERFVIKCWQDWESIEEKAKKQEIADNITEKSEESEDEEGEEVKEEKESEKENIVEELILVPGNGDTHKFKQVAPIVKHKSVLSSLDTQTKIKNAGKEIGWSMGNGTAEKIVKVMQKQKEKLYSRVHRQITLNNEAFGNSIKESYPLFYYEDGVYVEEYICPESWKENVGKTVPLGVYHDFWGEVTLEDWQTVGTAEVFGWDDEMGEDFVKYDYDMKKIDNVFKEINYYDWLSPLLRDEKTADISTAYYCNIVERWSEQHQRMLRYQVDIELMSISFVPAGNCPGNVCHIQETKQNADDLNSFIKKCIDKGNGTKQECIEKGYYEFVNAK